jgi:hypothetical protein
MNRLLQGDRRPFVTETVKADDNAKLGMCCIIFVILLLESVALEPQWYKLPNWACYTCLEVQGWT